MVPDNYTIRYFLNRYGLRDVKLDLIFLTEFETVKFKIESSIVWYNYQEYFWFYSLNTAQYLYYEMVVRSFVKFAR